MSITATEDTSRNGNNTGNEQRRRRIRRIKSVLLTITLLLLILPSICCVYLSIKMVKLQQQVDRLMIMYNIEEAASNKGSGNIAYAAEIPPYESKVASVGALSGQAEAGREAEEELLRKLQEMNDEKHNKKKDDTLAQPSGDGLTGQTETYGQASDSSLTDGVADNASKHANAGTDTAVDIDSGSTRHGDSASYDLVHITDIEGMVWPVPENWLGSGYNSSNINPDDTGGSSNGNALGKHSGNTASGNTTGTSGSNSETGSGETGGAAGNYSGNSTGNNSGVGLDNGSGSNMGAPSGNYPNTPASNPGSTPNGSGNAAGSSGNNTAGKDPIGAAKDKQKDKDSQKSSTARFQGKKVYITFDDGPSIYTDDILDILKEYGVKATFFVVGKTDSFAKEMYKRIVDEGHTLGMHSYSHKYDIIYNSVEDFDKDFTKLRNLLYDTTGLEPKIYRFPGGSANKVNKKGMDEFIKYLNEKSIVYYDWNVLNGDATNIKYTDEELIDNVLKGVEAKSTSIVLMHDAASKEATVRTLPALLEALIEGGAELYPLDPSVKPIQMIKADSVK